MWEEHVELRVGMETNEEEKELFGVDVAVMESISSSLSRNDLAMWKEWRMRD